MNKTYMYFAMLISLGILVFSSSRADALNCFQCNSTNTAGCTEKFDYGSRVLQSTSCIVADAGYCVKAIGVWGGTSFLPFVLFVLLFY